MNTERLLNVAKALRESPKPDKFSMRDYANPICGTPMCALGHYAARTDLQTFLIIDNGRREHAFSTPMFYADNGNKAWYDHSRVHQHFEIDEQDAEELFSADGCGNAKTPIEAAEYIERFVDRNSGR